MCITWPKSGGLKSSWDFPKGGCMGVEMVLVG